MMIIMPLSTIGRFLIGLVYDDNNAIGLVYDDNNATFNNR